MYRPRTIADPKRLENVRLAISGMVVEEAVPNDISIKKAYFNILKQLGIKIEMYQFGDDKFAAIIKNAEIEKELEDARDRDDYKTWLEGLGTEVLAVIGSSSEELAYEAALAWSIDNDVDAFFTQSEIAYLPEHLRDLDREGWRYVDTCRGSCIRYFGGLAHEQELNENGIQTSE